MEHRSEFYRELAALAIPIILQNLLSAAVGAADTLMLNYVGQTALSAASLANQIAFVLSLFFTGLTAGEAVLMAQYLGKQDAENTSRIFFIAFRLSAVVSLCFAAAAILTPEFLMRLFTSDPDLCRQGGIYLRIVGFSYLFSSFSQVYLASLKARKRVRTSALISVVTLCANVLLNAVVLFGLFGVPPMGIFGVALATVLSRGLEAAVCGVHWSRTKTIGWFGRGARQLSQSFWKVTLPITLEGFVWGGAMAVLAAIMGRMGSDAVAANSVASSIQNTATVASFGFAEAGAILLGNDLGKGSLSQAKVHSRQLMKVAVISGAICCGMMLIAERPITGILNLSDQGITYFSVMYRLLSVNVIFAAITYTLLCGIFPAGGDTRFGLYCDGAVMWGFCVLLGSIAAFVLKWDPIWVFVLINLDELVKTPVVLIRLKKDTWLVNLTQPAEDGGQK
ncbi:MAG: MATE family efflux transporter [Massiliimalia sp.]|jgi:putative MATE family efflux protein